MEDVKTQVYGILTDVVSCDGESISDTSTLVGDLDLDSLELLEFGSHLEECFGIEIPEGSIPQTATVANVVETVENILASVGKK